MGKLPVQFERTSMKTLHRALLKDVIATTLITIGILTFVLVIGNIFTRLFDLLVNNEVPLRFVVEFVVLLIPFSLVFTLPWGLLTAVILVYGRMSADSELVAVRASGISVSALSAPVLLLSVICSGICLVINLYVSPYAQNRFKALIYNIAAEAPTSLFDTDAIVDQFPDKRIYVGKKLDDRVENLHVWDLDSRGRPLRTFRAAWGQIYPDEKNNAIVLKLHDARMEERNAGATEDLALIQTGRRFDELPLAIPLDSLLARTEKRKGLGSRNIEDLMETLTRGRTMSPTYNFTPILTEIQKRVASSLSCITFVLVGIPLAIRSHRRETSVGVAISFGVVFAYYFLIIVAETFKTKPGAFPEAIIWAPNLLFQVLGLWAFLRVARQ
jgi:lipopolysaccharide export system permease protein